MMFNKNKLLAGLLCVATILSLCACGEQKKDEKKEVPKPEVYEEKYYGDLVRNAYIEYNGNKIDAPFTVQQLIDAGFLWQEDGQGDVIVPVNDMSSGDNTLKIQDEEKVIHFIAHNVTDRDIPLKECVVTLMVVNSDKITINGITPYKTTYEDVIKTLGKDVADRKATYKEESAVCYEEGRRLDMAYFAKGDGMKMEGKSIDDIILQVYVATDQNTISHVSLQIRE